MLILILCCLCISDIEQARYLVKELQSSNPQTSKYLEEQVRPAQKKSYPGEFFSFKFINKKKSPG